MPHFLIPALARACEGKPRTGYVFGDGAAQMPYPHAEYGWFQSGAHVKTVQRMLGHASAAMTLDVYAELFDEDLDTVAVAMSKARAKAVS